jgi:uncharacterized membrane protein YhhN
VPRGWFGWFVTLGLMLPAFAYAIFDAEIGQMLAAGLIAFLFGLGYAMAQEERRAMPESVISPTPEPDPTRDGPWQEA